MGRIQRSWLLMKQSFALLRANPMLAFFPIISGVVSIAVLASFILPIFLSSEVKFGQPGNEYKPLYTVVMFVYYVLSYFVVTFFNAGLIYCSNEILAGRPTTLGAGMRAAGSKVFQLLAWSVLAATVGTILRTIGERAGFIGQIITGLLGAAWSIVTFFTVPILVLEGVGPIDAVKDSFGAIKRTWGESMLGGAGISLAVGLVSLAGILVAGAAIAIAVSLNAMALVAVAIIALVLLLVVLATVSASLEGIYRAALYRYAKTGSISGGFDPLLLQEAFVPKKAKPSAWS